MGDAPDPAVGRPLVLVGAGGHAAVVADIAGLVGMEIVGLLTDGADVVGDLAALPILGGDSLFDDAGFIAAHRFVVAIGGQRRRAAIAGGLAKRGARFAKLVHPTAVFAGGVTMGEGSVAMAGVIVNAGSRIGRHCILNTGASLDHHGQLADGVHLGPQAVLAGTVTVGEGAFCATNCTIIPNIAVGAWATVAAGAVVMRDVPDGATAIGNPARNIRPRAMGSQSRA